ncbi:2'-5' RNA ligase family protein [Nostoc ellipsosporum NOK]|nr:2'-5' RNA ligase family protein [Nostoc ellipsosporum NOK]
MKNITMPPHGVMQLSEYLLVLQPPPDLDEKVKTIRNYFADTYDHALSRSGRPHFTLVKFKQHPMQEDRLRRKFERIASMQQPFLMELRDYGSFPSHTIYIQVATKDAFKELVKELRTETQRMMKTDNENKPHFILEPHLTIARKLKPWQFEKGWLEFQQRDFSGKFIASSFCWLRRIGEGMPYQAIGNFSFRSQPVEATQATLFI